MSQPYAPRQLPELRAELLEHYRQPDAIAWWAQREATTAVEIFDASTGERFGHVTPTGDERRVAEVDRLEKAMLFHVSPQMTDLAIAAAATLPAFSLESFDVPAPNGFMIFSKPIYADPNFTGETCFVAGVSWSIPKMALRSGGVMQKPGKTQILWLSWYVDLHLTLDDAVRNGLMGADEAAYQKSGQPRYTYSTDCAYVFGQTAEHVDEMLNLWGKVALSAWILMQQKLARVTSVGPDRASRRRLERQGRKPATVRVIELRQPDRSDANGGGTDREYHHQWIVRGHWRQQWYPAHQVHRPMWIAPHVKGPEGAPMLGGEKVYAWKR